MDWLANVLQARFLVSSLGETASPPWWRTRATTATGQAFLARLFPRTHLVAGLETAGRAARAEHDRRIGRIGAYHLFRLLAVDEALIHDQLRSPSTAESLGRLATLDSTTDRIARLAAMAGGQTGATDEGPVLCGRISDLRGGLALRRMCAAYAAGFGLGKPAYPYLQDDPP